MTINGLCNKPIGPGGGTRRLHHNQSATRLLVMGAKQDRRGRKDSVFVRHGIRRYRANLVVANDNYAEARLAA